MRKIWILILCLALIGVGYYVTVNYLFYSVSLRGFVPAIKMPGKDVKQYLPQGTSILYGNFRIPRGSKFDIFADVDGNLPRVLAFDAQGNLLVTSTNKGKLLALPDKDKDGKADEVIEVLDNLNKPHGIDFNEGYLYLAETDKVSRYFYDSENYTARLDKVLFELPSGGRHFTRTIKIKDGLIYTSVGSSCDSCIEKDWRRAAILASDLEGNNLRVFASGLRNTVFFDFDDSGRLWGLDMGRDNLGDELPPDELNLIEEGKDYGWPWCYGNQKVDDKFASVEQRKDCFRTQAPVYEIPAHSAPLGLTFINSSYMPYEQGNMLIAYHGSWNRSQPRGYEVVKLNFIGQNIAGSDTFISGWLKDSDILGRPVDLIFDGSGNLYVSDDYAGVIYILNK